MNRLFSLLLFLFIFSCTNGTKVGVKKLITKDNAHLITTFDENDIESMVTYYFSSRIRQDDKWKQVLPPENTWSDRMKYSIAKHNKLTFFEFLNLGFGKNKYGNHHVKIWAKVGMNNEKDEGEDFVQIRKVNNKWIITKVPT